MRKFTQNTLNKEPSWRVRGPELKTGYRRRALTDMTTTEARPAAGRAAKDPT